MRVTNHPYRSGIFLVLALVGSTSCFLWAPQSRTAQGGGSHQLTLDSAIDLTAYRASLPTFPNGNGHTRSRLGKGCGNCWTDVTIIASDTARHFGPGSPPSAGDSIPVAFIRNIGTTETVMYSIKPSTQADYVVYVINSSGNAKWILVEVPTGTTGQLKIKHRGELHGCGHPMVRRSEADFRDCDYNITRTDSDAKLLFASRSSWQGPLANFMAKTSLIVTEDPGWISCSDGCCTMQLAD